MNDHSRLAPLPLPVMRMLRLDAENLVAAARRKGYDLAVVNFQLEAHWASTHFITGSWLHYYHQHISESLINRIECARLLFEAKIGNPQYRFYTVFDFGKHHYNMLFEMGDGDAVVTELRRLAAISSDKAFIQLVQLTFDSPKTRVVQ